MRSLDDALPAAKTARASVSAVKNRHGDAEGGAAFRKTFADLGQARDTTAKTPAGGANAQPDEPADITTTGPSVHTRQIDKVGAAPLRLREAAGSVSREGEPDLTSQASVTRGESPSTKTDFPASPEAPDEKTDALALLSLVTAAQPEDTDGEAAVPASPSDDAASESRPALPKTTQTAATSTLSATLALKAIKADPATVAADDTTEIPATKSRDVAAPPRPATPPRMAAAPVAPTLEATMPAIASEPPQEPDVHASAAVRVARTPSGPKSADTRGMAEDARSATPDTASPSLPKMPPQLQAVAPGKIAAAPASDVVEPEADTPSPQVAARPLLRQAKQETIEMTPEPAEASAAEPAPAAAADIRSLMAILGPVPPQPAVAVSARDGSIAAEMETPTPKVAGDRARLPVAEMAAADGPALPTSTDGADPVFRFARADGKVSPISLRAEAERPASKAPNDPASAKAETVTVLDARRYLGIAPTLGNQLPMTANAQAVAAAITGNGDPTQALQANTGIAGPQGATGKVVNTLKIQMHPIDLGLVTATLRLRDDELQIDLRVQTGDAYRQLTNDQDAMIKALRAQGFQVDQVNVIFTPSDSAGGNDGSGQPQSNQQQPSSQNGRDSQGGLAAGNGGEGRNGGAGQRSADDGRTRHDTLRETPAAPQPAVSDELYF
ncbi:flagellar hook-length control protein FliK [Rhizobium sp. DKSPLA3]|uniref:Flagellar hook-length control protein FliK n=1 Tax=Rhizobium quercicola TaxID=2901226 RepID=A0A9X1NQH1_9HYPH|nr:flagellar hook-length control protein FliK [Rhizobium quercicola]MCD7108455.1 flagellar hook-length control protein FliK [Rhizobium quercicola]